MSSSRRISTSEDNTELAGVDQLHISTAFCEFGSDSEGCSSPEFESPASIRTLVGSQQFSQLQIHRSKSDASQRPSEKPDMYRPRRPSTGEHKQEECIRTTALVPTMTHASTFSLPKHGRHGNEWLFKGWSKFFPTKKNSRN